MAIMLYSVLLGSCWLIPNVGYFFLQLLRNPCALWSGDPWCSVWVLHRGCESNKLVFQVQLCSFAACQVNLFPSVLFNLNSSPFLEKWSMFSNCVSLFLSCSNEYFISEITGTFPCCWGGTITAHSVPSFWLINLLENYRFFFKGLS